MITLQTLNGSNYISNSQCINADTILKINCTQSQRLCFASIDNELLYIVLAPTGAQEMLIFVCSFIRSFGSNLSGAANLHHSG